MNKTFKSIMIFVWATCTMAIIVAGVWETSFIYDLMEREFDLIYYNTDLSWEVTHLICMAEWFFMPALAMMVLCCIPIKKQEVKLEINKTQLAKRERKVTWITL